MGLNDQMRRAVKRCGQTRYAIAKETGVSESTLSRFMASGKGLSLANADRLCEYLGLTLTAKAGKARKGR